MLLHIVMHILKTRDITAKYNATKWLSSYYDQRLQRCWIRVCKRWKIAVNHSLTTQRPSRHHRLTPHVVNSVGVTSEKQPLSLDLRQPSDLQLVVDPHDRAKRELKYTLHWSSLLLTSFEAGEGNSSSGPVFSGKVQVLPVDKDDKYIITLHDDHE